MFFANSIKNSMTLFDEFLWIFTALLWIFCGFRGVKSRNFCSEKSTKIV